MSEWVTPKNEIIDLDKKRWYKIKRGWFGRLVLGEEVYTAVRKHATGGEITFSDCGGIGMVQHSPCPITPQSQRQRQGEENDN